MKNLNVKSLGIAHINSYYATIENEDVLAFQESEKSISVTLRKGYQFKSFGTPRWESIKPFDKDEISALEVELENGEKKNIYVPFKDVSTNGAFGVNKKSSVTEDEHSITIEWRKGPAGFKYGVRDDWDGLSDITDSLEEAEKLFESAKDYKMSDGVTANESFISLVKSDDDFETETIVKKVIAVEDEEQFKDFGHPKEQGMDWEYWAKWKEV